MIIHEVCKRICEDCRDKCRLRRKRCPWLDIDNDYCEEIYKINELINDIDIRNSAS